MSKSSIELRGNTTAAVGDQLDVAVTILNPAKLETNGMQFDCVYSLDTLTLVGVANDPAWTTFRSERNVPGRLRHIINTKESYPRGGEEHGLIGDKSVEFVPVTLQFQVVRAGEAVIATGGGTRLNYNTMPFQEQPNPRVPLTVTVTDTGTPALSPGVLQKIQLIDDLLSELDHIQWKLAMLRELEANE